MSATAREKEDPMKVSTVFMLGTVSGAVIVGLWRRELQAYAAETSRRIRAKAGDGERSLRCAEEVLQSTKERVGVGEA